jgi:hypothetical protein
VAAYSYSAINAQGCELNGELTHPTSPAAREQLRIRGLLASKLDELPSAGTTAPQRLQEGQAEDTADLLAAVRDR